LIVAIELIGAAHRLRNNFSAACVVREVGQHWSTA